MKSARLQGQLLNHVFGFVFVFIFLNALSAIAGPNRTTYQAKIIKPDGLPLEAASVNFKFTILNPLGTCILYSETHSTINMANTGGVISFALGSGVKTYPVSATTFEDVFSNITPTLGCDVGGPPTYSPAADDIRKIVMQFHDGLGWQTLPAMNINAVPYAMFANDAQKLGGVSATAYLQTSTLPSCTASEAIRFNGTSFSCVAVGGAGGSVTSGSVITALGYTPADGASVTAISSSLSTTNASVASVSSSVFSVSSTVTSLANTVAASFAAITSSGGTLQIVKEWTTNSSTNIIAAFDSYGADTSRISLRRANGSIASPTAITAGQSLGNINFRGHDGSAFGSGANAAITAFAAENFSASGTGTVLTFATTPVSTIGAGERMRIDSTGYVGIGTQTPVTTLDVSGGIRIGTENATCAASFAGTLRYNSGVVEYCNGTAWAAFGVSGAGILAINGLVSGSQTFAFGDSGNFPNVNSVGSVHTFNFPNASTAAVSAGLISNTDYTTFNNKMNATSAAVISAFGYTPDSASATLATARLPAFSGDVQSSSGSAVLTLASVGAGVTSGAQYTKVTVDGKGRVTSGGQLSVTDVTTALGYTPASASASTQWLTSGTAISYSTGNVGVGTVNPVQAIDVLGFIQSSGSSGAAGNSVGAFTFYNRNSTGFEVARIQAFQGDADLNSGSISFQTGDSGVFNEKMRIAHSGQVGIATSAPRQNLDIAPATGNAIYRATTTNAAAALQLYQDMGGGNYRGPVLWTNGGNLNFGHDTTENAGPTLMTLTTIGYLGVGTLAPSDILHVQKSVDARALVDSLSGSSGLELRTGSVSSAGGGYIDFASSATTHLSPDFDFRIISTSAGLNFQTPGANTRILINAAGDVGIGLTNPTAKFHLAAGSASAAPLKLTSGTLLSSPQTGSIEFDGTNLYYTDGTNARRTILYDTAGNYAINHVTSPGDMTFTPNSSMIVSSTATSTNSSTGALIVKGGLGVGENINASGAINVAGVGTFGNAIHADGNIHTGGGNRGFWMDTPGNFNYGIWRDTSDNVHLRSGGTTNRITIVSSTGYVGVGTSTPLAKFTISNNSSTPISNVGPAHLLHILGADAGQARLLIDTYGNGLNTYPMLQLRSSQGTASSPTPVVAGDNIGSLRFTGNGAVSGAYTGYFGAAIEAMAESNWNTTSQPAYLRFMTTAGGGILVEKMRIDSNGNVGIGVTAPTEKLDINGNIRAAGMVFHAPPGDPAPTITARTVPAGQGAASEKTELILFHTNDFNNGSGVDQIALRAPALSFQTYLDATVADINNNSGYNERMYITPSGQVGIGTTTPANTLDVSGGARIGGLTQNVVFGYDVAGVYMEATGPTAATNQIRIQSSDLGSYQGIMIGDGAVSGTKGIQFYTGGTGGGGSPFNSRMVINETGNIGINSRTPTNTLTVSNTLAFNPAANTNSAIMVGNAVGQPFGGGVLMKDYTNYAGMWTTNSGASLIFGAGGTASGFTQTTTLVVASSGAVGVGTAAPTEKLEVVGNVKVSGEIYSTKSWGFKKGPLAFVSDYMNSWASGYQVGTSLDCTSSANGCTILKSGTYEIRCVQRANSTTSTFIGLALTGDRITLEGYANGVWSHDHSITPGGFTESNYMGPLTAGQFITCGPPTANSTFVVYSATSYNGTITIKRLD